MQESRLSHEYCELKKKKKATNPNSCALYTGGEGRKSDASDLLFCRYSETLPKSRILIKQQGICKQVKTRHKNMLWVKIFNLKQESCHVSFTLCTLTLKPYTGNLNVNHIKFRQVQTEL